MADTSIWSKTKPASFEVAGRPKVIFPVRNNVEGSHGLRVVRRAVPFVDGQQLDETGLDGGDWTTEIPFFNELMQFEPDLGDAPVLYPDRLEQLEALFALKATGTLHLPWRRNIRCKAVTWRRVATTNEFDGETLSVSWAEDNEAKLDNPSTSAGIKVMLSFEVQQAVFEAEREGMWDGGWEQLTTLASQLEETLSAPSEMADDVANKANRLYRCCDSILTSFTSRVPGRNQMNDPSGGRAHARVRRIRDAAARAEVESRGSGTRYTTRRTDRAGSIWSIAAAWGFDAYELLELNRSIPDPNYIEAGFGLTVPVV